MPGQAVNPRQAQLDAAAQKMGFPSYEAWQLFDRNRMNMRGTNAKPIINGPGQPAPVPQPVRPAPEMNWFQKLSAALSGNL